MEEKIRTLLVDDQLLFVESLKTVLETRSDDIEVVGIAYDGREALQQVAELSPNVVLMDVRMPVMDGVEATRVLTTTYPDVHVVMLTTFNDDSYVKEALKYGAAGYVLKDIPPGELISSIRAINDGSILISPRVANKLLNDSADNSDDSDRHEVSGLDPQTTTPTNTTANRNDTEYHTEPSGSLLRFLSRREIEVLKLIGRGYHNALIAKKLSIAEQTVKNHVSVIYSKLNIHDRVRVMKFAESLGEYLEK